MARAPTWARRRSVGCARSGAQGRAKLFFGLRDDRGVPDVDLLVGEGSRLGGRTGRPWIAIDDVKGERTMLGGERRPPKHVEHLDGFAKVARRFSNHSLDFAGRNVLVHDQRYVARRRGETWNRGEAPALLLEGGQLVEIELDDDCPGHVDIPRSQNVRVKGTELAHPPVADPYVGRSAWVKVAGA